MKKFVLIGGAALALAPAAMAQRSGRIAEPRESMALPSARSFSAPVASAPAAAPSAPAAHGGNHPNFGATGTRGSGNWSHNGSGNHHGHHDRRCHPRYYYPFDYGYPYWSTSASFYSNGYNRAARGGSVIAEVQQELAQAGYYRGAIDGIIGQGTRSAIRAYERAHRLPIDGRIDEDLLAAMGLS